MLNEVLRESLENIAEVLRRLLDIDEAVILKPDDFDELCKKIQKDAHYQIVNNFYDGRGVMILDNWNHFTFYLFGSQEQKFYDLVEMYTYAIILNKNNLTPRELDYKEFLFPRPYYDSRESEYLMRAFMLPQKTFQSTFIKYSNSCGYCSIEKMQKEVGNRYCYKRGQDLHFWSM